MYPMGPIIDTEATETSLDILKYRDNYIELLMAYSLVRAAQKTPAIQLLRQRPVVISEIQR